MGVAGTCSIVPSLIISNLHPRLHACVVLSRTSCFHKFHIFQVYATVSHARIKAFFVSGGGGGGGSGRPVHPYGKAVFVRISDEYAVNILQTAMFTVIVRYIFTSCREYPANKVGLTKK